MKKFPFVSFRRSAKESTKEVDRPFYTRRPFPWFFAVGGLDSRHDTEGTDCIERLSALVHSRSKKYQVNERRRTSCSMVRELQLVR